MVDDFRRRLAEALWPPAKAIRVHPDEDDFCQRNIMPTVDRIQRIRDAELESWRERAEKAEADLNRVHELAKQLKQEAEQGKKNAVIHSQVLAWRSFGHAVDLLLAALEGESPTVEPETPAEEET